jgi:hypothetical protein
MRRKAIVRVAIHRLGKALLILLATGLPALAAAASSPLVDSVNLMLAQQNYRKAEALLGGELARHPRNTEALYQLLATRQTEILDYEAYALYADGFLVFADSVIRLIETALPQLRGPDSTACLFYLANAVGGKGLMHAKLGNWLSAVRYAKRSASLLKGVVKRDSTFFAAYLGIGVFNYYLCTKLGWLPFITGSSADALNDLRRAARAPFPYDMAARNTLCWVFVERKQWADADSLCHTVLSDFPRNTMFLRIATCIAMWTKKWEEAEALGRNLVAISQSRDPVNWSDLLLGYRAMAEACGNLHDREECRAAADAALRLKVPEEARRIQYVREHLRRIAELRAELKDERR